MPETKYAPAERLDKEALLKIFDNIKDVEYIQVIIDSFPNLCFILNSCRQVVFANSQLLNLNGFDIIEAVIGMRPGELLQCTHADKETGGCGTSEHCRYCGAVNTILKCQANLNKVSDEFRLISERDGLFRSFDFKVSASPFTFEGKPYVIFTMVDISDEKRRRMLERSFFHDIINKIGSLKGFVNHIKQVETEGTLKKYIGTLELITNSIYQEIDAQRQLTQAENGELEVKLQPCSVKQIVEEVVRITMMNDVATGKHIKMQPIVKDTVIISDPVILQRILLNMLKNALESITYNGTVSIDFVLSVGNIVFEVYNPSYMPHEVQMQVFQRSFSTKGKNRGLGTYGMKLLGENYLKGEVYFRSDSEKGTTFFLSLPKHQA